MGDVFDLDGRVAVITGGGTGIGRATAHVLADRGAQVVLASRKVENLERVAGELPRPGHESLVVPTDVRDAEAVRRAHRADVAEQSAASTSS